MIFTETALPGAFVIEPERLEDQRGFFARTWCAREFGHARGVRWDDPAFGIRWPDDERIIAARDQTYPDFTDA